MCVYKYKYIHTHIHTHIPPSSRTESLIPLPLSVAGLSHSVPTTRARKINNFTMENVIFTMADITLTKWSRLTLSVISHVVIVCTPHTMRRALSGILSQNPQTQSNHEKNKTEPKWEKVYKLPNNYTSKLSKL